MGVAEAACFAWSITKGGLGKASQKRAYLGSTVREEEVFSRQRRMWGLGS